MPTFTEVAQLLTSIAAMVAAVTTLIVSIRSNRKIEESGRKIEEVRHATNSLTDRLVETTRIESLAKGLKQGREGG